MNRVLLLHVFVAFVLTLGTAQFIKRLKIGGKKYNCNRVKRNCDPELLQGEACATNGRTFTSLCELIRYACDFDLDEEGNCKATSPNTIFGTEMAETTATPNTIFGTEIPKTTRVPKCPKCSGATGPEVCSNEGITYKNDCRFRRESCKREHHGKRSIQIKHEGECVERSYSSDDDSSTWLHADYVYEP